MSDIRKYVLIIILLNIAVYANSSWNGFVWDDNFLIVNNPSMMSWQHTWMNFVLDLYHSFSNYYRPIQMVTYTADFSFWRLNPFGYHLTNILLHALVSVLFFIFSFIISTDKRIAFAAAVLYSVHPANTGAVAYVAGRADILMAIFMLLSFIFFNAHFRTVNPGRAMALYAASLISFLLSLLSKENAVIIPALLLLYRLFFINREEVDRSRGVIKFHYLSCFIIICGVYLILRSCALNFQELGLFESKYSLYSRLLTFLEALSVYLGIVFFPVGLHMERSIDYAASFWDRGVMISFGIISLIVLALKKAKKMPKGAYFGLIFFFVSLLPVSGIIPMGSNLAEHWLYVPLMGIVIFVSFAGACLWDNSVKLRPLIAFLFTGYLIFFTYQTVDRNLDWKNDFTIYTNTLRYAPYSVKILNNMGNLYHGKKNFNKSLEFLQKAVAVNPREHRTHLNLGIAYESMGDIASALRQYEISRDLRPDYSKAYLNIGNVYLKKGELESAAASFKMAIDHDEFNIEALNNLGNIYFDEKLYKKAKEIYEKILKINPYIAGAHNNLANTLSDLDKNNEAIAEYGKAVELDPDNAEYLFNLGTECGENGMYEKAIDALKKAYCLRPKHVPTLLNLGSAYFYRGDRLLAAKEWSKVIRLDPENEVAKRCLKLVK